MKPCPVSRLLKPGYPTRREFLAAGALATLGISGCGNRSRVPTIVAPVFEHGDGRGAGGCIVVSPPVFLSEEEALQVVREELAKSGILLGRGRRLDDVIVTFEDPDADFVFGGDSWLGEPVADVSRPGELTAIDRRQSVGIAIVTREDCERFRAGANFSSVTSFDTKGIAEAVADALAEQTTQELCIGVFYDPLEKADPHDRASVERSESDDFWSFIEKVEEVAKNRSRDQLRQQVGDFVTWMKENR